MQAEGSEGGGASGNADAGGAAATATATFAEPHGDSRAAQGAKPPKAIKAPNEQGKGGSTTTATAAATTSTTTTNNNNNNTKKKKAKRGSAKGPPASGLMRAHASYSRMNFLAQASAMLVADPSTRPVSRYLSSQMAKVASRNVLRVSRQLKGDACRHCREVLVPGLTAIVRMDRKGGQPRVRTKCVTCGTLRKRVATRDPRPDRETIESSAPPTD